MKLGNKFLTVGVGLFVCIVIVAIKLSSQVDVATQDTSSDRKRDLISMETTEQSRNTEAPRQELPTDLGLATSQTTPAKLPKDHSALIAIRSLLNAKNIEAATDLLQQQISSDPSDDVYLEEMAMLQLKLGKSEAAEKWLRRTIEINPRNQVAMGELTDLLTSAGRSDEAIDVLKEITQSCNDSCPAANLALGEMLMRSGELDQAIAELMKAAVAKEVKEAALQTLTSAYEKGDDRENAASVLSEILSIKRKHLEALKAQGVDVRVLEKSLKEDSKKLLALEPKEG